MISHVIWKRVCVWAGIVAIFKQVEVFKNTQIGKTDASILLYSCNRAFSITESLYGLLIAVIDHPISIDYSVSHD